jgi:integrase
MATYRMKRTKTPSVYKRGGRYVHVWRHRGVQQKDYFATYAEAREAKARRQVGDRRKTPRIKVAEYAPKWIESYRGRTSRGFAEGTRRLYKRDIEAHIVPFFGTYRLDDIDAGDVKEWFVWLEQRGLSFSAIRKAKATLGAMYGSAIEERKARSNPVLGVRYVPSTEVKMPRKRRPLTLAELERLRAVLPSEWRLFFALLVHTGVRIGEMTGLRWGTVHLGDDPSMSVREQVTAGQRKGLKTANGYRVIPLSQGMARALSAWREQTPYPAEDDPVFASKTGAPLDYSNLYGRVWAPARDAAGIPGNEVGAFHAFRHTLGSLIHDQGAKSDRQLSDWLGHADIAFTQRVYVGTMDRGLGDADFLDELIPVQEWATDGQHATRRQPQIAGGGEALSGHSQARNGDQRERTAGG